MLYGLKLQRYKNNAFLEVEVWAAPYMSLVPSRENRGRPQARGEIASWSPGPRAWSRGCSRVLASSAETGERRDTLHMRSSIDGSGENSNVASVSCRAPRAPWICFGASVRFSTVGNRAFPVADP